MDASALQQLLSARGSASTYLRHEIARFVTWMSKESVPWAAIRGFLQNRLIALDKMLGICPIGIGVIWRRIFCKTMLLATKHEATKACGTHNLYRGLEAGIEGGIHSA